MGCVSPSVISRLLLAATLLCVAACGASDQAPAPVAAAARAHRIVSLAPSFTETLIALGAGDDVVGIGRFDPAVPGHADLPRLGDAMGVNLETLTALAPDAVLVNSKVLAEKLAPVSAKMRVVELPTDRLDDALAAVTRIAALAGRDREGASLGAKIRESVAAARVRAEARRVRGDAAPVVLVVVQRRPFYTAGRGSFVDDLLTAVGARNAFGDVDQPWPSVSEESIVARAPQVILDASVGDVESAQGRADLLADWQRFPTVPAVRDRRVLVIREDAVFRAGPRIPEAIDVLERLLFGTGTGPK